MTAMTGSSADTKLSKELVERAAAGRHQDVDQLLKDGADTWIGVACVVSKCVKHLWHPMAFYGIV